MINHCDPDGEGKISLEAFIAFNKRKNFDWFDRWFIHINQFVINKHLFFGITANYNNYNKMNATSNHLKFVNRKDRFRTIGTSDTYDVNQQDNLLNN